MPKYSKITLLEKSESELVDLAKEFEIEDYSKLDKNELIQAIVAKTNQLDQSPISTNETTKPDESSGDSRDYKNIFSWLGGYLIGSWTFVQFLDWILMRNKISPYWTDLCLWILLGILPSFLIYLVNMDRINQFVFRRWEKIVIPANLILIGTIVFFMFRGSDLGATMTEITYTNADGVEETKKVMKEEFKKSIPIFSFDYKSQDSIWYDHCLIMHTGIAWDLDAYPHISTYTSNLNSTTEKIARAKLYTSDYYIDGTVDEATPDHLKITVAVRDKKTGKRYAEKSCIAQGPLAVADSLVQYLPDLLNISAADREHKVTIPFHERCTNNLDALKHFALGSSRIKASINFEKAIEYDSTFALAYLWLAQSIIRYSNGNLEAKVLIDQAMKYRRRLPIEDQMEIMFTKHQIYQEWDKAESLMKMQLEQDANNESYQWSLCFLYLETDQWDKLYDQVKSMFRKDPTSTSAGLGLAQICLLTGRADEVLRLVNPILLLDPQNTNILNLKAIAHIHLKEYKQARENLNKAVLIDPEKEVLFNPLLEAIDYMENHPAYPQLFTPYLGVKKAITGEQIFDFKVRDNQLVAIVPNQQGYFFYPNSDTSFVHSSGFSMRMTGEYTDEGALKAIKVTQQNNSGELWDYYRWVYDDLIANAESLVLEQNYTQASMAYEKAIKKHPEHYYLNHMKAHLNYLAATDENAVQEEIKELVGKYESKDRNAKLWIEEGLLFYKSNGASRRVFRPIGNHRFVNMLTKSYMYEFDVQNGKPVGLIVYKYDEALGEFERYEDWYLEKKEFLN